MRITANLLSNTMPLGSVVAHPKCQVVICPTGCLLDTPLAAGLGGRQGGQCALWGCLWAVFGDPCLLLIVPVVALHVQLQTCSGALCQI